MVVVIGTVVVGGEAEEEAVAAEAGVEIVVEATIEETLIYQIKSSKKEMSFIHSKVILMMSIKNLIITKRIYFVKVD